MSRIRYTDEAMQIKARTHLELKAAERVLWEEKRDWEARRSALDRQLDESEKDLKAAILIGGEKAGRVMIDGVLFTADLNRISSCQLLVEPCRVVGAPKGGL